MVEVVTGIDDEVQEDQGDPDQYFDKVGIIAQIQTPNHEKVEHVRLKLCKRTELEQAKIFARMIPLWITFIMCGVVSSIGDTYFLEQAYFNMQTGKWLLKRYLSKGFGNSIFPIEVKAAMLFSIPCYDTAAVVETRRLELTKLLGEPEAKIPMNMFGILPQYFFLAALVEYLTTFVVTLRKSLAIALLASLSLQEYSSSVSSYLRLFTNAAFGVGTMGSSISVHAVGKFSVIGRSSSWFQISPFG
ncbi:protein NRT1/ PTR FAMILY 5.5-like [Juglans microcarpa x Juglans regia]|uniref:protein NRT1/ PTR FAMILY 5.5-like n=1 Tax=Juglans microcarpa x Juglans regia TaxID=2249226 RepID=UPI001B7F4BDA|nr:protein NRT1/ PTR FAMILY 5.5-like [Juglans microcarpa x Juglans regia]